VYIRIALGNNIINYEGVILLKLSYPRQALGDTKMVKKAKKQEETPNYELTKFKDVPIGSVFIFVKTKVDNEDSRWLYVKIRECDGALTNAFSLNRLELVSFKEDREVVCKNCGVVNFLHFSITITKNSIDSHT